MHSGGNGGNVSQSGEGSLLKLWGSSAPLWAQGTMNTRIAKALGVFCWETAATAYTGEHQLSAVHGVPGFAGFDFGLSTWSLYHSYNQEIWNPRCTKICLDFWVRDTQRYFVLPHFLEYQPNLETAPKIICLILKCNVPTKGSILWSNIWGIQHLQALKGIFQRHKVSWMLYKVM